MIEPAPAFGLYRHSEFIPFMQENLALLDPFEEVRLALPATYQTMKDAVSALVEARAVQPFIDPTWELIALGHKRGNYLTMIHLYLLLNACISDTGGTGEKFGLLVDVLEDGFHALGEEADAFKKEIVDEQVFLKDYYESIGFIREVVAGWKAHPTYSDFFNASKNSFNASHVDNLQKVNDEFESHYRKEILERHGLPPVNFRRLRYQAANVYIELVTLISARASLGEEPAYATLKKQFCEVTRKYNFWE